MTVFRELCILILFLSSVGLSLLWVKYHSGQEGGPLSFGGLGLNPVILFSLGAFLNERSKYLSESGG